ncbi:MAG: hypothetical protein JWO05_2098 [Gemmatimonadetes bacterium]|nr:hypothetical protein [Gemmatimonadota bacterium]
MSVTQVAVAGIPLVVEAPAGVSTRPWLHAHWPTEGREPPVTLCVEVAPLMREGLTTVVDGGADAGRWLRDAQGTLVVEASGVEGGPLQQLHCVVPGSSYVLRYAALDHVTEWQWRWPRTVMMHALPSRRLGMLAHATGVLLPDGSALLVPGVSGTGKSTFAQLASSLGQEGWRVLSDDRVSVTRVNGEFVLSGTPWYSSGHFAAAGEGVLRGVLLPRRGGIAPELARLTPGTISRELLRTIAIPAWDESAIGWALDFVDELARTVRAWSLSYTPGVAAAELIAHELGALHAGALA